MNEDGRRGVLVVGAGPTGLVLALWLTRLGIRVRIMDKAPTPGETSRAVAVQARTLELYRQLGAAEELVQGGRPLGAADFWVNGKVEARVEFRAMGEGLSPFPYVLIHPQDEHEKVLVERLAKLGVVVERPTELLDFENGRDRVAARLRRADGSVEICEVDYLAGCDGARSSVRHTLKIEYPDGTYAHLFYVADVEASGPTMNGELNLALDEGDFLLCFPLKPKTRARLIGSVRAEKKAEGENLEWSDVDKRVIERIHLDVARVNWFSSYHVHHRVARAFRVGRSFLLGDAAHIHSPAGGQGMNTGIGDAANLAWKLAAVLRGRCGARILDSYEEERIPFARRLVETTDRLFEFVTARGPVASRVRVRLAPYVLATVFRSAAFRRFAFLTVSQIQVSYRGARLSEGRAGGVCGGDRLPWVPLEGAADNFASLTSLDWQAHVYGDASNEFRRACRERHVPLHVLPWSARAKRAGLARDAVYLVRPDGYVALATPAKRAAKCLEKYLDSRSVWLERGLQQRLEPGLEHEGV